MWHASSSRRADSFTHTTAKKLWSPGLRSRKLNLVTPSSVTNPRLLRVLGVDPAAAGATGYGVIESDGCRCRMLRFGALAATRKGPAHFPERLRDIHAMLAALIEEFQPHSVAVESVFTA